MFRRFTIIYDAANKLGISTSRSISTYSWKGNPVYKAGSLEQQDIINAAFRAAAELGFDAHGAKEGIIAGSPFHNHAKDQPKWITVAYKDDNGNVLWHKKKDGSEWDRIHIFQDPALNMLPSQMPVNIYTK